MSNNNLTVLIAPDPLLKIKAKTVEKIDDEILMLLNDMEILMYKTKGIGLAAPQIGISKRLLVIDTTQTKDDDGNVIAGEIYKMINPEITWASEEENIYEEGCLSLPEHFADVIRPKKVKVKYLNKNGEAKILEVDGLLATCLQHEIDHLDGILFVDHISRLKRGNILKKLKVMKKNK